MKVIVDTSIWSLALRRKYYSPESHFLELLVEDFRVVMIGPIRQEILSGIADPKQLRNLKEHLSHFPDSSINTEHYELAAKFYNDCRKKGVQGSHVDFLICAVASYYDYSIYTIDKDFEYYSLHIPIKLLASSS